MANLAVNCWNRSLYYHYQNLIQTYDNLSLTLAKKLVSQKFSSRWRYCKDLVGHFSCVNAIAFSKKGGEYLVSGGDDTRVLVWRLAEAVKGRVSPRCLKRTHLSNIFCASFDSENKHILTAGNDDQILKHDFETGELVTCLNVTDATYDLSIHPENDNIFITAGEHGKVDLYDVRTPSDTIKLAEGPPTFHSAVFNPVDPAVLATASSIKGVQLWDARTPLRCLKSFDSNAGSQCAMGVTFDQTGQYLATVRQRLPPVVYHINRNTSLIEFYQEGYHNSCTMKSVCFAGDTDNFIVSGSDDFNVYIWKIPKIGKDHEGIAKVNKNFLTLRGHRSIVNQVCFNKHNSMLCTAGVEKVVKMWSPFPMADGKAGVEEEDEGGQRILYSRMDYARMIIESGRPLAHDYGDESTSEDPRMMAFFDTLVERDRDSSTDSELSFTDNDYDGDDDDDDDEQNSSRNDILRSIRAIAFEEMRNFREHPSEENVTDDDSESRIATNNVDSEPTSDISNVNEACRESEEGVDLARLRQIITSQQGSTNTRKKIADLRRDCLKNEEKTATSRSSSQYKNSKESENDSNENELPECSTSSNPWQETSQKHVSSSSSENEDDTTKFKNLTKKRN